MTALFLLLVIFVPAALVDASSQGCVNATIPSILNLGTCLKTSLELCEASAGDIVNALVDVVECIIPALLSTNALGALAALLDIISIVVTAVGGQLGDLQKLLKPLCEVAHVPGCLKLLTKGETCKAPISVTLPGNLNLAKCLDNSLLLCEEGKLATDGLVLQLIKALACLLTELFGSSPGDLIFRLASAVVGFLCAVGNAVPVLKYVLNELATTIEDLLYPD
ncbi:uncharacterized protein LOC144169410 isoform X2 [Haemaphysalis longicornis]